MIKTPRVLGIIPARSGSKRLPGKNLRQLGHKTLVERVMEAAVESKRLTQIILSSDADEILRLAKPYESKIKALKRPENISRDESTAIEYVGHTLHEMKSEGVPEPDYIVIIQPSSPFTRSEDIDGCIESMEKLNTDCAATVREIQFDLHPSKLKCIQDGVLIPYFENESDLMARHALRKVYVRNGSVYVTRLPLIQKGSILNHSCAAYIMPPERSLDINDALDWEIAEFMWYRKAGNDNEGRL